MNHCLTLTPFLWTSLPQFINLLSGSSISFHTVMRGLKFVTQVQKSQDKCWSIKSSKHLTRFHQSMLARLSQQRLNNNSYKDDGWHRWSDIGGAEIRSVVEQVVHPSEVYSSVISREGKSKFSVYLLRLDLRYSLDLAEAHFASCVFSFWFCFVSETEVKFLIWSTLYYFIRIITVRLNIPSVFHLAQCENYIQENKSRGKSNVLNVLSLKHDSC